VAFGFQKAKHITHHTEPFHSIISIIFKSKENLDNNIRGNPSKNDPFIGYSETSDLMISGPLIEFPMGAKPPTGTLLLYYSINSFKKSIKEMASLRENGQK